MHLVDGGFASEFRRSGLTVGDAALEFGCSERQVHRYLAGECPVPKLVAESRLRPKTRAASRRLFPSMNTKRRTAA